MVLSLGGSSPKLLFLLSSPTEQQNLDKDAITLFNLYSANFYKPGDSKPFILHKPMLLSKFCILQVMFKKHTQISFCTQMFISQLNIPFKHKEWILNLHKDELKMKSLQYSTRNYCVLGHYWHLLFNIKNKDRLFKNHATGFLALLLWPVLYWSAMFKSLYHQIEASLRCETVVH